MNIKIMIVPGVCKDVVVPDGSNVLTAAAAARVLATDIDWVELAKAREVRVNGKKFSNTESVDESQGFFGSITSTPLETGQVVMIVTKVKGNGLCVLVCTVNGEQYSLETPDKLCNILASPVGMDVDNVASITVNGEVAHLEDMVGNGDDIQVSFVQEAGQIVQEGEALIVVNGVGFNIDEKDEAMKAILDL